jgi:hypothetical protein
MIQEIKGDTIEAGQIFEEIRDGDPPRGALFKQIILLHRRPTGAVILTQH